ncbi:hypothetical protein U9M48_026450 [Paspalum notatum var. saurae]|uniref:Protein kinase domain-containing protein n=1 Tax=Paspalum notatum var. saurae TaxID=547442 RepID=A0AAQ3TSR3_PASNO
MDSSSCLWTVLGQASSVAQLVGVDALGLVSMVVQAALAARRLAQLVETGGGLLRELELDELMRREATRRPLEQLRGALRRCYALVTACQDCGYLRGLLVGARMAVELRAAEQEINMFIRLAAEGVPVPGAMDLQEQKILDTKELFELCSRTEESCPGFRKFEFSEILDATNNLSEDINGELPDGFMIAVKRLNEHATVFDFSNEFLLAKLQHTNLVRLLGWCIHDKERILVYKLMRRGGLHQYIFDKVKGPLLDWSKRLNIIKGLADGLVYMHKHSMLSIVHRDLKPDNVLLDHDMNPKISDFGSAITLSSDAAEGHTRRVVGTCGYKAPEYASRGIYSVKTDVFSFGVLALAIISGRKNTILGHQGDTVGNLVRDAWQLWNDRRLDELVDPILGDGFELAEVMQYAQVALLCAQEDPVDRPTMSDVAALLRFENISILPDPKQPSKLINGGGTGDKLSTCVSQSSRTIDITIISSAPVSTGLWTVLGQVSNVAQVVGVDALGLVSMVVQAALAARRHRDACRRLAQHVEVVGGLLRELELAELMRREATRRPLEQLQGALRRCYALVTACQDCGYLRGLLVGARMAEELRAVEQEIDMFIRLVPLIALVDTTHERQVKGAERVPSVAMNGSSHHVRLSKSVTDITEIHVQGAAKIYNVVKQQIAAGEMDLQEQKILDPEELLELCTHTQERCPGFKKFDFSQIDDATDNFSEDKNIGYGGFANVYKGQLPNGSIIAVKRMDEHATMFDFSSEFLLARLQHTNVIRLLGWCIHGKERILVYDFMHKGSLHQFIFDKRMGTLLGWSKRLNIIKGLAAGLVYLHKQSMLWIVHRDLKPRNILLDHDMNPKISDFGSARTLSSDVTEERTSRVVGTSGYKAPEYTSRGVYSLKTDVFSFGVMALVIISGRKNTILEQQGDSVGDLAWQRWNDGRLHELVDPILGDGFELSEVMRYAQVALLCAQEEPADRPTMPDVLALLNFESISLLPDPKPPSGLIKGGASCDKLSTCVSQSSRTIDITITSSATVSTRVHIIASNVAQLAGVDALGLVSMVVQAALAARRHRDACRRLAQHVEVVGGLLRELEVAELMRREATRRPLEQLRGALRRCYALVTACQDCGYLRGLLVGARMAEELRAAEQEIDMFIRLIPLVDTTHHRRVTASEHVPSVVASYSDLHTRISTRAKDFTEIRVRRATVPCEVEGKFLQDIAHGSGKVHLQEQKIMDVEELVNLCTRTEERCPGFRKFDFLTIVNGTDGFSEERILGRGGYGTVYKGQLSDGTVVAIKRLDENATLFDFNSELQLPSLQHITLIRLLGWCVHEKEMILVYEFMCRGSLDQTILDKTRRALLNWHMRLRIIKGIAEGLVYMHKQSLSWIIHGDLKPSNILLDHDMSPKIADFGSARILSSDATEAQTSRVVGTSGYMAPEYASRGLYSVKTDVFSFGVLALVTISGRKNIILEKQGDTVGNLVRDAWRLWNDGRLHELVDPMVISDGHELAEIVHCAQVALLCAQEDPTDRPTMSEVVAMLNLHTVRLLPSPKQPRELSNTGATNEKLSTHFGQSSRTIDITITSSAPGSTRSR